MLSALAMLAPTVRSSGQARSRAPYGIAFHTTGSGLPANAIADGEDPFQAALRWYATHAEGPTYVIGWKPGQIAAVAPDEALRTFHIGVEAAEKAPLIDGRWRQMVTPATVAAWNRRHGADKNPLSADGTTSRALIPGDSPNDLVIGVEMVPVTNGSVVWAPPMRPGLRFTAWQHTAARQLAEDVARRYAWPSDWRKTRVFGHEDLNPLRRHDAGGGWDPGALRSAPYIDLDYIRGGFPWTVLAALAAGVALLAFGASRS